jgi:hypothetical protein
MISTATFCILLKNSPKQLDQDEFLEILDQATEMNPDWHEVMVNANWGFH